MAKLLKTVFLVVMLASLADATCETRWDICVNKTFTQGLTASTNYVIDMSSIRCEITPVVGGGTTTSCNSTTIQKNIEDEYYYSNTHNLTNWNVTVDVSGFSLAPLTTPYMDTTNEKIKVGVGAADGAPKRITVTACTNGTRDKWTYTETDNADDATLSISETDFDVYYRRNWTFRDESGNSLFNFTGRNSTLSVWCNDFSEFELDIPSNISSGGDITIQTRQLPKFFADVATTPSRIRQDSENQLKDNYYLATSTATSDLHDFTLQDYTGGDFYLSTIKIRRSIGDTVGFIHVERFQQDNKISAVLLNNTQYSIDVEGTSLRNLGPLFIESSDTTHNVIVTTPDFTDYTQRWSDLTIAISSDYDNGQVSCGINSTELVTGEFNVYNVTSSGYDLDYTDSTTTEALDIGFSYAVPDINGTYRVYCEATGSKYGLRSLERIIHFRNESAIYRGFDLDFGSTIWGISRSFMYKLVAFFFLTVVCGLFSARTYSKGALAYAGMLSLFWWVGWTDLTQSLVGLLAFLAIMLALGANRRGLIT